MSPSMVCFNAGATKTSIHFLFLFHLLFVTIVVQGTHILLGQ
jgi:hypothetical protein